MPAANQAAAQTEQHERDAQQLAKLGASPAVLLLASPARVPRAETGA
jgi:hypothetical protein